MPSAAVVAADRATLEARAAVHDAAVGEDRRGREVAGPVAGEERDDAADLLRLGHPASGMAASSVFIFAGSSIVEALIGVATAPGPTPTTVTPCGPSSTPAVRVSMRMPPLDRQYGVLPGIGQSSCTEVMLMIRPPVPWAIICLAASWVPKKALFRLIAITLSYCASVVSSVDVRVSMPALFTMMSSWPNAFTVAVDEALQVGDLADVGLDADDPVAERGDLPFELLLGLLVGHVVDDDGRAGLGEGEHDRLADAAVAAGDDGDLAGQCHGTLLRTAVWMIVRGRVSRSRSARCSPTRMALAIAVSAGFTAPMLGKKLVSTT